MFTLLDNEFYTALYLEPGHVYGMDQARYYSTQRDINNQVDQQEELSDMECHLQGEILNHKQERVRGKTIEGGCCKSP